MKRGTTWSYVIRVKDPETGVSKPRWVGGFATEEDAKAARDEARVKARHGDYIDRNRITVAAYLDDWIGAHAMEIKPRTLADYRACIRLCRSRPSGRPPSPTSTATCWPVEAVAASRSPSPPSPICTQCSGRRFAMPSS